MLPRTPTATLRLIFWKKDGNTMENTDQADLAAAWQAGFNTGQAVHGGSWESWMELWSSNKIRGLHLYSYFGSRS